MEGAPMNNIFNTHDIKLLAKRVLRMAKNGETDNPIFIEDATALAEAFEHVDEIIFKEDKDE